MPEDLVSVSCDVRRTGILSILTHSPSLYINLTDGVSSGLPT